jgi:hypothetical protein
MAAATKHQIRVYVGGTLGRFAGTPGTAVIETGEVEGSPGGMTFVSAVKPKIDTASVTLAVGYRDALSVSVTYTSETAVNSRSAFAGFRVTGRYLRARLTATGAFNAAQGFDAEMRPAGI